MAIAAQDQEAKLEALDHVPEAPQSFPWSVVNAAACGRCRATAICRAMIIARRQGFSNDQWQIDGANLMKVDYFDAGRVPQGPVADGRSRNGAAVDGGAGR